MFSRWEVAIEEVFCQPGACIWSLEGSTGRARDLCRARPGVCRKGQCPGPTGNHVVVGVDLGTGS